MNQKVLNILALVGCFSFLFGNIAYDWLDKPDSPANPNIFYLQFSIMVFTLVLMCYDYAKKQRKIIAIFWWFFLWMSIGQLVKFALFNPFVQLISDYAFLTLALLGVLYKLYQLKFKK